MLCCQASLTNQKVRKVSEKFATMPILTQFSKSLQVDCVLQSLSNVAAVFIQECITGKGMALSAGVGVNLNRHFFL